MTSSGQASRAGIWIGPRSGREGVRLRLFCLPHAGAGTAMFNMWQRSLPASVEVCPILLPGREGRLSEPSYTQSEALIEQVAGAVAEHLDLPYAIFGHSMGALLAAELAQSLVEKGLKRPSHLFVSGRNASHIPLGLRDLHTLPDDDFIAALDARYGGMPKEILETPELLDLYLPILRADLTLLETHDYRLRTRLSCPISVFAGKSDVNVSSEKLLAWQEHTTGAFEMRWFEGGHFYLTGPGRLPLLELLNERLTAAVPERAA